MKDCMINIMNAEVTNQITQKHRQDSKIEQMNDAMGRANGRILSRARKGYDWVPLCYLTKDIPYGITEQDVIDNLETCGYRVDKSDNKKPIIVCWGD